MKNCFLILKNQINTKEMNSFFHSFLYVLYWFKFRKIDNILSCI